MRVASRWAFRARAGQAVWRELATFVDRVRSARDTDADHLAVQRYATKVLTLAGALAGEAGGFLAPPPEVGSFPVPVGFVPDDAKTVFGLAGRELLLSKRVPGEWDAEAAVRSLHLAGALDDLAEMKFVVVRAAETLLTFVEIDEGRLVARGFPVPANLPGGGSPVTFLNVDEGYFSALQRKLAAEESRWSFVSCASIEGVPIDDVPGLGDAEPKPVTSLLAMRPVPEAESTLSRGVTQADVLLLQANHLIGAATDGDVAALRARAAAWALNAASLRRRVQAIRAEAPPEGTEGLDDLTGYLDATLDALAALQTAYTALAATLVAPWTPTRQSAAVSAGGRVDAARTQLPTATLREKALATLDPTVDTRIAYPSGTLRQLRLLEVGLAHHLRFRLPWLRRERVVLDRVRDLLFAPFYATLKALRAGTTLPGGPPSLTPAAEPIAVGARRVVLAGAAPAGLSDVEGGTARWLLGDRPALAVVTATGVSTAGEGVLTVLPLAVSTEVGTAKRPLPGSAGVIGAAPTLARSFVRLTNADLRRGRFATRPEADGALQQAVNLWSSLCLLHGTAAVTAALGAAWPSPPGAFLAAELVLVEDGTRAFVAKTALVGAAWWDDLDAGRSLLGRVGELLLVQGTDATGLRWQSVAEVRRVRVLSQAQAIAAAGTAPADAPVCCGGPGEVVVLDLAGLAFPEPVAPDSIRLGRDFLGFGAATLACREVLPKEVDPAWAGTAGTTAHRGPELQYALSVLDRLLGQAP